MSTRLNHKKSIWVDARLLNKSGIGRYIAEILPSIHAVYDLTCIVSTDGVAFMETHRIKYKVLNTKIYALKEQFELPAMIESCDLFWSPHFNIPLFPIKAKKRLVTIHDAYHLAFSKKLSLKEKLYANLFFRMALRLSDAVITVSAFSKAELVKFMGQRFKKKIKIILNGVTSFDNTSIAQLEGPKNYFLFVGNIKPHKNLKNAILAFKSFCIDNPDENYRFKIVGQKSGFINADQEVETLLFNDLLLRDRVDFTGFVADADLKNIYQNAYCLIFPSLYEGFGLPPLESMLVGTPAIISNRASMPELCGNAVLYFDPENINSIKNKITEIVTNKALYEKLSMLGVVQAKRYTWKDAALKHLGLLDKLIN
jgi:glycosyltransferase involved in cell wall biosynthesis